MCLVRSVSQFVLAFLRQTCLTYVCTQILLLPLTRLWSSTCIRALEAPGLYYDACMTYLCFRVVLWYLPVSPWSWSYTFACMISVRLNRGRHKLVSEPTACRNPPSNSLAEVESRHCKTFTNMAVCLTGPRRHWVVLGSFTPRPLLWDSGPSPIRVKWILLNLTLGSRYHFHPESPLLLMIVCCTWRPWRYSPLITRELVFIAFAIPFHR